MIYPDKTSFARTRYPAYSFRFISTDFIFNMKISGLKNIERKENKETCMNTILNNNIRD